MLSEAKLEKNSKTLFTTETRSTRRCTENPDASVRSPCPPCLRGETGRRGRVRVGAFIHEAFSLCPFTLLLVQRFCYTPFNLARNSPEDSFSRRTDETTYEVL